MKSFKYARGNIYQKIFHRGGGGFIRKYEFYAYILNSETVWIFYRVNKLQKSLGNRVFGFDNSGNVGKVFIFCGRYFNVFTA